MWFRRFIFTCGILFSGLTGLTVSGAEIRLSFIEHESVLTDTCQLLKAKGFAADSVAKFARLVRYHNQPGNRVDRSKFPPQQNGYYHFDSFKDLTNRTTCGFSETPGSDVLPEHTLMCFDVASLLLKGLGHDAPHVADGFLEKGFLALAKNGRVAPMALETFHAATGVLSPTNGYETLVGAPRSDAETRIGLSLRTKRRLPAGCTDSDKDLRAICADRIRAMERDGFRFPRNCQLGLGLVVNTKRGYVWGDHSFICIKRRGRFICLEKNGPKGPYVRVEFKTEQDMADYMGWDLLLDVSNPETAEAGSVVLVSLNERLLGIYRPPIKP